MKTVRYALKKLHEFIEEKIKKVEQTVKKLPTTVSTSSEQPTIYVQATQPTDAKTNDIWIKI